MTTLCIDCNVAVNYFFDTIYGAVAIGMDVGAGILQRDARDVRVVQIKRRPGINYQRAAVKVRISKVECISR